MSVMMASWVRPVGERDGIQRKRPKGVEQRAAEAAIAWNVTNEWARDVMTVAFEPDPAIQTGFFGVGGLIHAAIGLAGGTGGFLTKRSGFSRNAWSSVI